MSKINKPNKPDNLANRPLNKAQPPQPPAKESQKLEVVKIISPVPPKTIDPANLEKAKSAELADLAVETSLNANSGNIPENIGFESAQARQTKLIAKAVSSASKASKSEPKRDLDSEEAEIDLPEDEDKERLQPIPPATEPMQYRAIGVIRGRFVSQEDNFSKGQLLASDGTAIDAVLLGKIISIVKKRLDMENEYLWVVYPRTNDKTGDLHVQIAGVWAPVEMGKSDQPIDPGVEDGYFSVRGEVVDQSIEQNLVLVKVCRIEQKPEKKKKNAGKTFNKFKLRLAGLLPANAIGQFWDINVQRDNNVLNILDGEFVAQVPMKKPFRKPGGRSPSKGNFSGKPKKVIDKSGKVTIVQPQTSSYPPPTRPSGSSEDRPRPIIKRAQPPVNSDN